MPHSNMLFPLLYLETEVCKPWVVSLRCSIRLQSSARLSESSFGYFKVLCRSWLRRRHPSASLQKSSHYGNLYGSYSPSGKTLSVAAAIGSEEGLLGQCSGGQCYSEQENLQLVGARSALGTRGLYLADNSSGLLQAGRKEEQLLNCYPKSL